MNMWQKLRMLELLNEMRTILLEDINNTGAAPASAPFQPQDETPQVDALAQACQKLDQNILSGWSAEEAQATQQAALDAAFQREREMWTPEVGHEQFFPCPV